MEKAAVLFFAFLSFCSASDSDVWVRSNCDKVNLDDIILHRTRPFIRYELKITFCWYLEFQIEPDETYILRDAINARICRNSKNFKMTIHNSEGNKEIDRPGFDFNTLLLRSPATGKETTVVSFLANNREPKCLVAGLHHIQVDIYNNLSPNYNQTITRRKLESEGDESVNTIKFAISEDKNAFLSTEVIEPSSDLTEFVFEGPENSNLIFVIPANSIRLLSPFTNKDIIGNTPLDIKIQNTTNTMSLLENKRNIGPFRSEGNSIVLSFRTKDALAFRPDGILFQVDINVLSTPLDCPFEKIGNCSWEKEDSSKNPFLLSPWVQTTEPLCLTIDYRMETKDVHWDSLFIIWETDNNSTQTLHVDYMPQFVEEFRRFSVIVPENSKGRIRMDFKSERESSTIIVTRTSTKKGACSQEINCQFEGNTCGWTVRPKGLAAFYKVNDNELTLRPGGQIMSPKMKSGSHCLEVQVKGFGRLSFSILEGVQTMFLESQLINTNKVQSRRFIFNGNDTQIILSAQTIRLNDDRRLSEIKIFKTTLLPIAECSLSSSLSDGDWDFKNFEAEEFDYDNNEYYKNKVYHMGSGILGVDLPLSPSRELTVVETKKLPYNEWFCFDYKFLTSPLTNNLCLKIIFPYTHHTGPAVLWTQCSPMGHEEFATACIPPRGEKDFGLEMVFVVKSTSGVLGIDPEKVWKMEELRNTILISSPKSQKAYDCDVEALDCGWHQSTMHSVMWSKDPDHSRFVLTPLLNSSYQYTDFLISPPFGMNSTSQYFCLSFLMHLNSKALLGVSVSNPRQEYGLPDLINTQHLILGDSHPKFSGMFRLTENGSYIQLAISLTPLESMELGGSLEVFRLRECNVEENFNCSFDSGTCGWVKSTSYVIKKKSIGLSSYSFVKMAPPVDSQFSSEGGYMTLFASNDAGNYLKSTVTSPSVVPLSSQVNCLEFSYYMYGLDGFSYVTLYVEQVFVTPSHPSRAKNRLWSQDRSPGLGWMKVRMPFKVNLNEKFFLKFEVKVGPKHRSNFVIAIDSTAVYEGLECENSAEFVLPTL